VSKRRYRGQLAAWLLIGLVIMCLLGVSMASWVRPRRIRTHLDAVSYVLDRQGIAYDQIRVAHTLTGLLQRDAYAAGIIIRLPDGREVQGSIDCRVLHSICSLDAGKLGFSHEPLPELDSEDQWPWLAWLDHNLPGLTLPSGSTPSATSAAGP
jgi:hypothetical protein